MGPVTSGKKAAGGIRKRARILTGMTDEIEAAWEAIHDALLPGWYLGRPSYHDERDEALVLRHEMRPAPRGTGLSYEVLSDASPYRSSFGFARLRSPVA
jgi:hypothetical protein